MLRVRVCAAHMGGFLGQTFSRQGSLFRQIFHKHGWVFQKLAKNSKKWVFSAKIHHKSGYDIACVQTLLTSFQRGSPPVESAHRRPNPCSEPRAIPSLEEPIH